VADLEREQYLYLTTRGRKSGRPREIEIWFTHRAGRFYVIAEYETSNWLRNLRAEAKVKVRIGVQSFTAQARVLTPEADAEVRDAVRHLSQAKYGWSDGTVVELIPEADSAINS
jgi:deazaflavin-dependent oxidoreductase (nitroreductase family)